MNDPRVVLVYPSNPNEPRIPDRPPLGLLTVAAPLVAQGVSVDLLDERAEPRFDQRLIAALDKKPLCVGISSMSGGHIAAALRVSRLVREHGPTPIVWGGVHPTLMPESTARHELVDIVVRDDGEETFPQLLETFRTPSISLDSIAGLAYKRDGNVILTASPVPADIDKLPLIPFHLVDLARYRSQERWTNGWHVLPIETSRGCPFSCSFCTESMRKKKWRALPPERVISDLKTYIRRYGIKNFTFIDDNLFGDIRRGERIVSLLAAENLGISWYTNIRTDYMARADAGFIRTLSASGCRMLTFGAESGSARILKMIRKRATASHVVTANRKLRGTGIIPHFVLIRGFPSETREDLAKTFLLNIRLLLENDKAISDFPFLIPTPGTLIARQCLQSAMDAYTLEDWIDAFSMGQHSRPPWISRRTYAFIRRHRALSQVLVRTNRPNTPAWKNALLIAALRLYRAYLRRRFRGSSQETDRARHSGKVLNERGRSR